MSDYYILKDGKPEAVADFTSWSLWFEHSNDERMVERTTIGDADISTVFLAPDHAFNGGPPLLYETMVFGGPLDGEMKRYASLEEARQGHQDICRQVEASV